MGKSGLQNGGSKVNRCRVSRDARPHPPVAAQGNPKCGLTVLCRRFHIWRQNWLFTAQPSPGVRERGSAHPCVRYFLLQLGRQPSASAPRALSPDRPGHCILLLAKDMPPTAQQKKGGGFFGCCSSGAPRQPFAHLVKSFEVDGQVKDLQTMPVSALRQLARRLGCDGESVDEILDTEDRPRQGLVDLVLSKHLEQQQQHAPPPHTAEALLRAELEQMKIPALRKRAKAARISAAALEEAMDAEEPEEALICFIVEQGAPVATAAAAATTALSELKLWELRKHAKDCGISADALETAMDAEEPEVAAIQLLLNVAPLATGTEITDVAQQQLREELMLLKQSALRKRAAECVDGDALEAAEDSEEPQEAIIALLLTAQAQSKQRENDFQTEKTRPKHRPHFAAGGGGGGGSDRAAAPPRPLRALFGKKHCMLSYQWDHQKAVQMAHKQLAAAGVPCWMDVTGGMQVDIYDSMAEGVTNASCVVCFMTQGYQDSENCALELKFSRQNGVAIVPVMLEAPDESGRVWRAGGWLGIITAGMLYTPLHDSDTFDENIQNLLRQITLAVSSQADLDVEGAGAGFSIDDGREELERLRAEETPATAAAALSADGGCPLPSQVPLLPAGLRVSTEMKQLRRSLLTRVAKKTKLSFCGMGGIGKSTISAWLVRDKEVRGLFGQVVWAALGQEPNIRALQDTVHLQLTGKAFDEGKERKEQLRQAMAGKEILLVLDDMWELDHEKALDFIDDSTASKVLISSRVRGLLVGSEIVEIGVPTETEAIEMLLSAAGQADGVAVPEEARAVVQFCNCLPLAIGMAGKLAQEIGLDGDWCGVVELLEEEFSGSGQTRSMEERVIRTSLNAIKGKNREKIVRLLHAFAMVPEDIRVPLEVVMMLYQAENNAGGGGGGGGGGAEQQTAPNLLSIRRWLKVLLDRNLILGSVDRPSLHDIVKDFVVAAKSDGELRASNRRLVELWRSERPPGGWDVMGTESVSQYMAVAAAHHIRGAWSTDWSKDTSAINWLSDFVEGKQDAIPVCAADALGAEHVAQLAKMAEAAGDWWASSLRWSAAALAAHRVGGYGQSVPLSIASANALERVEPGRDTCTQEEKDQLEMAVLLLPCQSYSAEILQGNYPSRLSQILERARQANPDAVDVTDALTILQFGEKVPAYMSGDVSAVACADLKILQMCLAALETVHETDQTRRCQLLCYHMMAACCTITQHHPDFDWDELYGKRGALLVETAKCYDYSRMNTIIARSSPWLGYDGVLFPGVHALATCWGDFAAANLAFDQMLPSVHKCLEVSDPVNIFPIVLIKSQWVFWLSFLGRREDAHALLHFRVAGCPARFDNLESAFAWFSEVCDPGLMRPRGSKETGMVWGSVDGFLTQAKCLDILVADYPAAPSVIAELPSPEQAAIFVKGNFSAPCDWNSMVPAMLAHERCGCGESALACTSTVLEREAWKTGVKTSWETEWEFGSNFAHYFANACRGRLLAAQGKLAAAEAAFEAAVTAAESYGAKLLAALAVRDLCEHVLDVTGRGGQGQSRLKESVSELACSVSDLDSYVLPRGPVLPLVFAAEGGEDDVESRALREELSGLKMSELKKRAVAARLESSAIDDVDDSENPKEAIIALLLDAEPPSCVQLEHDAEMVRAKLREELSGLKMSELRKRAVAARLEGIALDDAADGDNPKEAIIVLLLGAEKNHERSADDALRERLLEELSAMKISALRKRAAESVDDDALEEAEDSEDPRAAMVALLLDAHASIPQ